ncbi:MAG: hypothetical protein L6308_02800 [Candidatus Omnitrophica bacterium]|nr:hypothetical protein [Candidatus Omnitrophota bacterium]
MIKKRDIFWKIYAWGFLVFLIAGAFNPAVYGWALYIPLSIGCLLFAHNKPVKYVKLWRVFLYIYLLFFIGDIIYPILSILNKIPPKVLFISIVSGIANLILMSPALYALWKRGYAPVRIK